jgi:hypothetical protein
MHAYAKATLLVSTVAACPLTAMADSAAAGTAALEQRIGALEARIAALEAVRTFTSFMPNFAERFHVMHQAGEAGDWAVASHELAEMKRLSAISTAIDADKGELMQRMMTPSFEQLEAAIGHGNQKKFEKALNDSINACNACHRATGSEFIEVTLDVRESLSLRHPHRLMPRDVPGGHHHGASAGMGRMMQPASNGHEPHDDTGKPAHKHAPMQ